MTVLIDSHAHLDDPELSLNIEEVLSLSKETGLSKIIVPGVLVKDIPNIISLIDKYDMLYGAVACHPQEADSWTDESYEVLNDFLKHPKMIAIGETGLDYYWVKDNKDLQKRIFDHHISLAKENNLPLIIHDREAHGDILEFLKKCNALGVRGVMHCFSGSKEFAMECIKQGFYIGLGGPVTFKNAKKTKEVAQSVPLEHIMIETDSPYLTPHPHRGKKPNMPHYVKFVAEEIALLKNLSFEKVAEITTKNSMELFKLDG